MDRPELWLLVSVHLGYGLDVLPLAVVGTLGSTTGRALLTMRSRAAGERFVPVAAYAPRLLEAFTAPKVLVPSTAGEGIARPSLTIWGDAIQFATRNPTVQRAKLRDSSRSSHKGVSP